MLKISEKNKILEIIDSKIMITEDKEVHFTEDPETDFLLSLMDALIDIKEVVGG